MKLHLECLVLGGFFVSFSSVNHSFEGRVFGRNSFGPASFPTAD